MNQLKEKFYHFIQHYTLLCILLLATAIFSGFVSQKSAGIRVQDAYDYAQLARNISQGKGYSSLLLLPVASEDYTAGESVPDQWRAPVFPLLIATFFTIFSPQEHILLAVNSICYLLLISLVYILGCRLYTKKIGVLSALVLLATPEFSWYAIDCLREPIFSCLFLVTCYLILTNKSPILVGVFIGFTYLTRYNFVFFIPPILLYLFLKTDKNRWLFLGKLVIALVITILPWSLRNIAQQKDPLFSLQRYEMALFTPTPHYPHYTVYRNIHSPTAKEFLFQHPKVVFDKAWNYSLLSYWPQAFRLPRFTNRDLRVYFSPREVITSTYKEEAIANSFADLSVHPRKFSIYVIFCIIVCYCGVMIKIRQIVVSRKDIFYHAFFWAIGLGIFIQFGALLFVHPVIRHFVPFLPLFIVYFIGEFLLKARQIWYVGLLFAIGILLTFAVPGQNPLAKANLDEDMKILKKNTKVHSYIVTNVPFVVSWRAHRKAIWIPCKLSDFKLLEKKLGTIEYFYYYQKRGKSDWLNTSDELKKYLQQNFKLLNRGNNGFLFYKKH